MRGIWMDARTWWRMAAWLGPWRGKRKAPRRVWVDDFSIQLRGERQLALRWYAPQSQCRGAYLIAPGFNWRGYDDPRMDRFCRVLAHSGFAVLSPALSDYVAMRMRPEVGDDLEAAFRWMLAHPSITHQTPIVLFSVSFGALPAAQLLAHSTVADRINHVVFFGGYANWLETVGFCLTGMLHGQVRHPYDPLTRPVVFWNTLPWWDEATLDTQRVVERWRRFVRATWTDERYKQRRLHAPIAKALAAGLANPERELFVQGCGLVSGREGTCMRALERQARECGGLDVRHYLPAVQCPVTVVHGRDDDVIPFEQGQALLESLPRTVPRRFYGTRLYGHSALRSTMASAGAALMHEAATLASLLDSLARPPGIAAETGQRYERSGP